MEKVVLDGISFCRNTGALFVYFHVLIAPCGRTPFLVFVLPPFFLSFLLEGKGEGFGAFA